MPTQRLTFTGHAGDTLAARLDMPDGPVLATALFAHCFTCSKDIPAARRIAGRLSAKARSSTFEVKDVLANSPLLWPNPVKSNRKTAMPMAD
ncbi:MAG: hypothetical protein AAFR45_10535, partial [Pseudomonadota bacterium]